jgi:hypothetical protein
VWHRRVVAALDALAGLAVDLAELLGAAELGLQPT